MASPCFSSSAHNPVQYISDVDIVTVNYNTGVLLTECVRSAFAAGARNVVVVDNASEDGSIELLEAKVRSPGLTIIRNARNLGYSTACNIGLRNCAAADVMFLNPDALLTAQALASMRQALHSASDVAMAGGVLRNLDGSEQAGGRRALPTPGSAFINAFRLSFLTKKIPHFVADFNQHGEPLPGVNTPVEAISGACMLVKRVAMADIGDWDENYFLHCEDLDLCMRFKQRNWSILFVPDASIVHSKGVSSQRRPIFVEWHKHRGMLRFYKKFFRRQYPSLVWYLVVLSVWFRFAAVSSLIFLRPSRAA
jgi:GT2 family glycosyltransferase